MQKTVWGGYNMTMKDDLSDIRIRIDRLDDELLELLRQRAELAICAGKTKKSGSVFLRPEREAEIIRRLSKQGGVLPDASIAAIYREIISACLAGERAQRIAYLGPQGTYSYDAARKHFGHAAEFLPAKTIAAVLREVEKENCDFAVVPLENSTEGTVGATMDALLETPLMIGGEIMLRIRHNLLSRAADLGAIRSIHAHPQALAQCRRWLEDNVANISRIAGESNAAAAAHAAADETAAAIASLSAASIFNLSVLADDIEDSAFNTTRFLILGRAQPAPSGVDKTSFIMTTRHESGAMLRLLEPMARAGVSMTKLESRPSHGQLWEYFFYVDVTGHLQDANGGVAASLDEIKSLAPRLKILGSYPCAAD